MSKLPLPRSPLSDISDLYNNFNTPICEIDCGEKCRVNNPNDKPFCCDITYAVPALYSQEWEHLSKVTSLWFPVEAQLTTIEEVPEGMVLRQCLGHKLCERHNRSLSCRQFPFFPYISSDYQFLGLAFEWEFLDKCWLTQNLSHVTKEFRSEFISTYDLLFSFHQDIFDNYHYHSQLCREFYSAQDLNLTILKRNGKNYCVDPRTEKLTLIS